MQPGEIVFQGKVKEHDVMVRYPTMDDAQLLMDFINTVSLEHVSIRMQGEQMTFEQEVQYVDNTLEKMKQGNEVKLLVFVADELVATGDITRGIMTGRHIGNFGIVVAQQFRGQGIGKKLMELLFQTARTELAGVTMITLEVFARNSIARRFYEHMDFVQYGVLPKGIQLSDGFDDALLMYRAL
jgi:ribosomal protein S18 acetylase RimI-like enzyme